MSIFSDLWSECGSDMLLETSGQLVSYYYKATNTQFNVMALVSAEQMIETINPEGGKTIKRTREMALEEADWRTAGGAGFTQLSPAKNDRFTVTEPDGVTTTVYAIEELPSRATGMMTILGRRVEQREVLPPGFRRRS